jgi:hypothetical protein
LSDASNFYTENRPVRSAFKKGEGLLKEGFADDGGQADNIDPITAFDSDSVVITFDNEKRQIYYLSIITFGFESVPKNQDRNIFDESTYLIENIELYRFIFTEEDYENAEKL